MSTVEQQGVGADHHASQDMDAAVEAQMGKIMTELGGALGVLLTSLGDAQRFVGRAGGCRTVDHRGGGRQGPCRSGAGS